MGVHHRAGLRPFLVNDRVHVHDLGVRRIDLSFDQAAVEVKQRKIFRFQIVE